MKDIITLLAATLLVSEMFSDETPPPTKSKSEDPPAPASGEDDADE